MKKLKFIVVVAGITFAFISSFNASAKQNINDTEKRCTESGNCGTTPEGCTIQGQPHTI